MGNFDPVGERLAPPALEDLSAMQLDVLIAHCDQAVAADFGDVIPHGRGVIVEVEKEDTVESFRAGESAEELLPLARDALKKVLESNPREPLDRSGLDAYMAPVYETKGLFGREPSAETKRRRLEHPKHVEEKLWANI